MKKLPKTADEYKRWPDVLHFGHLSLAEFRLDHGVGTVGVLQPPFPELVVGGGCVVQMEQVHGTRVQWVETCPAEPVAKTDGLVSKARGTALIVQTADCVPVLMFDPSQRVVAVVHVGWKGLASGVLAKMVESLQEHAVRPSDLLVGIGPAICQACYEIGPEVKEALPQATTILQKEDKWTVDLQKETEAQLIANAIWPKKVEIMRLCTKEHPEIFPSYRRDKTTQRFFSYIRLQS